MNKKYIFLIAIFIFWNMCLIEVRAEEVLFLMFTVYKNDTLSVSDLRVTDAPILLPKDKGDYNIEITNTEDKIIFSSRIEVQFIILTDPPTETDESLILLKIPWNESMTEIKFYHLGNLISIIELCNKNGQCESSKGENFINCPQDCPKSAVCRNNVCEAGETQENCCEDCECSKGMKCVNNNCVSDRCGNKKCEPGLGENFINCPKDCPSGSNDGYCDGKPDGICDPDCNKEDDIDCMKTGNNMLIYGIVFGVIVVLVLVIVVKSRRPA